MKANEKNREMEFIRFVSYADHDLTGKPENGYSTHVEEAIEGVDDPLRPGHKVNCVNIVTIMFSPEKKQQVIQDIMEQGRDKVKEMAAQGLDDGDFYDNVPNVLHQMVQVGMKAGKPDEIKELIQDLYREAYQDYDFENDDVPALEIWD